MKTTILKTLKVLLLFLASYVGEVLADGRELTLVKIPDPYIEEDPIEIRVPSRPIQCIISEESVFIQGYDAEEILSYEAYDINGVCHLATEDPQEFCEFVISNDNALEIRIYTSDYILRGYVDSDS